MTPHTPAVAPRRQPPEEQFWKHYSPHHEFPLSSVTSVGLHVLVLLLLMLLGWVAYKLGIEDTKPPDIVAVVVAGGGGSKAGVPDGKGDGLGQQPAEAVGPPPDPTKPPAEGLKDLQSQVGGVDPLTLPRSNDSRGRAVNIAPDVMDRLNAVSETARAKWYGSLGSPSQGGAGRGGGRGPGEGGSVGPGNGPGQPQSQRQKRLPRWSMTFSTRNGDDYARQLAGLKPGGGAILAVPFGKDRYEVIRDLSQRPARGRVEDPAAIQRMFWIDDKPESVAGLAHALQIEPPPYFVAFFPRELEEELARLEKQKAGNVSEDDIAETRFGVVPSADGYRPVVLSVRLQPR
jgi:hypothetical protein